LVKDQLEINHLLSVGRGGVGGSGVGRSGVGGGKVGGGGGGSAASRVPAASLAISLTMLSTSVCLCVYATYPLFGAAGRVPSTNGPPLFSVTGSEAFCRTMQPHPTRPTQLI